MNRAPSRSVSAAPGACSAAKAAALAPTGLVTWVATGSPEVGCSNAGGQG